MTVKSKHTRPRTEKRRIWEKAYREKWKHLEAARARHYRAIDPERQKLRSRKHGLMYRYGITVEQYDAMIEVQRGLCAICGREESASAKGRFHVDHDHETELVRALLCSYCNTFIGMASENPELLKKAMEYLALYKPQ